MTDNIWSMGRSCGCATCPNGHLVPVHDAPEGRALRDDEDCPQCGAFRRVLDDIGHRGEQQESLEAERARAEAAEARLAYLDREVGSPLGVEGEGDQAMSSAAWQLVGERDGQRMRAEDAERSCETACRNLAECQRQRDAERTRAARLAKLLGVCRPYVNSIAKGLRIEGRDDIADIVGGLVADIDAELGKEHA